MTSLVDELVPAELWAIVEPLLPVPPRPPYGGRRRAVPDRNCFAAIVYMARTSTPWRLLPARELGCGSPTTCWRRGRSGRRRRRPGKVYADKSYDSAANRAYLRRRGITARIARRGIESSARLGRHRWRVERSLSWLSCWRRLGVRWDRDSERWFAFVLVACAIVGFNCL